MNLPRGFLAIVIIACLTLFSCSSVETTSEFSNKVQESNDKYWSIDSVLNMSDIVYNPLMREPDSYYSEIKLSLQDNGIDYTNYWIQTVIAITKMHYEHDFAYAEKIIAKEMDTFNREGFFPRPAYQQFDYGWVSSMDAPIIAVASQMLYEQTGDIKYRDFVETLSKYMIKNVKEHGYVGNVGDRIWLFEYGDKNTTEETAEFVLNGSLLGTLGTAIIAGATNNHDLFKVVFEQTENYKNHSKEYLFNNDEWCYYMLNPKKIQQPHYAIYEIRILDALYEIIEDEFYKEQADIRRNMLLNYYQGFQADGTLYFLKSGAPHYYYSDIFDARLLFYSDNGSVIQDVILEGNEFANSLQGVKIPVETKEVEWISHTDYYEVYIGKITIENKKILPGDCNVEYDLRVSEDGVIESDIIHIVPDTGRTALLYKLTEALSINSQDIFIIELDNQSKDEYSMSIDIYDSNGNALSRYLPNLHVGKCSIPFSLPGFVEKKYSLSDLAELKLQIFAHDVSNIKIGNVYKFKNTSEYIQYLQQTEYIPIWQ